MSINFRKKGWREEVDRTMRSAGFILVDDSVSEEDENKSNSDPGSQKEHVKEKKPKEKKESKKKCSIVRNSTKSNGPGKLLRLLLTCFFFLM